MKLPVDCFSIGRMEAKNKTQYLESSNIIDWQHPDVLAQAKKLAAEQNDQLGIAKACFDFVRDQIKHSWDYQAPVSTCKASEVLQQQTGFCFAKSHLLAALLRANGIAAGLCYQRLSIDDKGAPFCLHGLNAVYLDQYGWYRIDARGNKSGVNAWFEPPREHLAYPISIKGEADLPEIWTDPLPQVVEVLTRCSDYQEVADNLPDIELI